MGLKVPPLIMPWSLHWTAFILELPEATCIRHAKKKSFKKSSREMDKPQIRYISHPPEAPL